MPGAFEPGVRSHLTHYRIVAGGGLLLLATAAYFGISAALRSSPQPREAPTPPQQRQ